MAAILGRFLYFSSIALSVGSKSFSDKGLILLSLVIWRFWTVFEKKRFKSFEICSSSAVTVSFSAKMIFSFHLVLSDNKVFLFFKTVYYQQYKIID